MIDIFKLILSATDNIGLSYFGADTWQEALEVLAESAEREAKLNTAGRASFERMAISLLSRRLEVED